MPTPREELKSLIETQLSATTQFGQLDCAYKERISQFRQQVKDYLTLRIKTSDLSQSWCPIEQEVNAVFAVDDWEESFDLQIELSAFTSLMKASDTDFLIQFDALIGAYDLPANSYPVIDSELKRGISLIDAFKTACQNLLNVVPINYQKNTRESDETITLQQQIPSRSPSVVSFSSQASILDLIQLEFSKLNTQTCLLYFGRESLLKSELSAFLGHIQNCLDVLPITAVNSPSSTPTGSPSPPVRSRSRFGGFTTINSST